MQARNCVNLKEYTEYRNYKIRIFELFQFNELYWFRWLKAFLRLRELYVRTGYISYNYRYVRFAKYNSLLRYLRKTYALILIRQSTLVFSKYWKKRKSLFQLRHKYLINESKSRCTYQKSIVIYINVFQ